MEVLKRGIQNWTMKLTGWINEIMLVKSNYKFWELRLMLVGPLKKTRVENRSQALISHLNFLVQFCKSILNNSI
jgi:hypothetical protein